MATFSSLVPLYLDAHSWLLHVPGLWSFSDWPDLTRLARARFLVQYRIDDPLFPLDGMEAAHRRLVGAAPRTRSLPGQPSDPAATSSTPRCRTRRWTSWRTRLARIADEFDTSD